MATEKPHHILAVDDIPTNLMTLAAILPGDEFSFRGCTNADEGFRAIDEQVVDLVLLDVLLPGIDGYAFARRLKADPRTASIPIIFLTALTDEDEVVKGYESGGVDFVSKPFRKAELLLRVRTHLALKDKNEELERAAEELRLANQARDRFSSILAHDLKNPFGGFLSLIQEMLGRYDSLDRDEILEILETMGRTAQNVYRLLETLLDWGRSQTGTLPLTFADQMLSFLVEEALEPLEESFRQKAIRVTLETGYQTVVCDRDTVVAIIRNLLSNAMKFTKQGGHVTLALRDAGEEVELSVQDTGVGIPAARQGLLFHIENKVSTPGTAREPGTGLGLILCAEFAAKNRGTLRVESTPGVGTTFFLRLPKGSGVIA